MWAANGQGTMLDIGLKQVPFFRRSCTPIQAMQLSGELARCMSHRKRSLAVTGGSEIRLRFDTAACIFSASQELCLQRLLIIHNPMIFDLIFTEISTTEGTVSYRHFSHR